jgi:hypothetical protein
LYVNPETGLERSEEEEVKQLLKAGTRLAKPEKCSQEMYKILLDCWHADPKERITFAKFSPKFQLLESKEKYKEAL